MIYSSIAILYRSSNYWHLDLLGQNHLLFSQTKENILLQFVTESLPLSNSLTTFSRYLEGNYARDIIFSTFCNCGSKYCKMIIYIFIMFCIITHRQWGLLLPLLWRVNYKLANIQISLTRGEVRTSGQSLECRCGACCMLSHIS